MPEHLQRSADRLAAFRGAKAELEAEARGKLEAEQAERREAAGWEFTPRKDVSDAEPEPRAQRNFTDPESRIMLSGKNVVQAYNSQVAVDRARQVMFAATLTNQAADAPHLPGLLADVHKNTGRYPKEVSADAGCCSEANVSAIEQSGALAMVAPGRITHNEWRELKAPLGRMSKNLTWRQKMKRFLSTKVGKTKYKLRQVVVEPVYGQIKGAPGLRQVLHRGLEKNECFWLFEAAIHNIL